MFYQKTTNKESWKLSKVKFCSKPNIQISANTKQWNLELRVTELLSNFIEDSEKALKLYKMSKNWILKEDGQSYDRPKICLLRQPQAKYLEQNKKIQ